MHYISNLVLKQSNTSLQTKVGFFKFAIWNCTLNLSLQNAASRYSSMFSIAGLGCHSDFPLTIYNKYCDKNQNSQTGNRRNVVQSVGCIYYTALTLTSYIYYTSLIHTVINNKHSLKQCIHNSPFILAL